MWCLSCPLIFFSFITTLIGGSILTSHFSHGAILRICGNGAIFNIIHIGGILLVVVGVLCFFLAVLSFFTCCTHFGFGLNYGDMDDDQIKQEERTLNICNLILLSSIVVFIGVIAMVLGAAVSQYDLNFNANSRIFYQAFLQV